MTVVPHDASLVSTRNGSPGFAADWLLDPAEIARVIGNTDFVPKNLRGNAAAITAALLYGAELGLGRMQSLSKISVIEGRPTLAAEAQRALILAAGHDLWIEESTVTRCTLAGRRRGSDAVSRVTWTLDDAKRARIGGKPNWQAYPRQMLLARATAELARAIFADAIGGLAATEEFDVDEPPAATLEAPQNAPERAEDRPASRRRKRQPPTPEPPEPQSIAAPEPDPPSEASTRKLFALFRQKGFGERETRLAYSQQVLDRPIASASELSALDIGALITALEAEPDSPEVEVQQALVDELDARPADAESPFDDDLPLPE